MTHAFFKACSSSAPARSSTPWAASRTCGRWAGLKKHMPVTYRTFWIGSLAIAGIPPLAGFFSKDEILHGAFGRRITGCSGRSAS